jgi:hypothetical protein
MGEFTDAWDDEPELRLLLELKQSDLADVDLLHRRQGGPAATVGITQSNVGGYMWVARWPSGSVLSSGPFSTRDGAAADVRQQVLLSPATAIRTEGRQAPTVGFLQLPGRPERTDSVPISEG